MYCIKYFFSAIFLLFFQISFSQISIDQELKGKVAGLTVFSQSEHLEHQATLGLEETDHL
jgi:hypothetical protein